MSAVVDPKGLKRVCVECGIRFYDMNKRPIICPNCGTEFTGNFKPKTRRGKSAQDAADEQKAKEATAANDDTEDDLEEEAEIEAKEISLEEAETLENDGHDEEEAVDLDGGDMEELDDLDVDTLDDEDLDDLDAVDDEDE